MDEFYYLNQVEKDVIANFLENKMLFEAVRKVLLSGIYLDGTLHEGRGADPLKNFILATMTTQTAQVLPQLERGAKLDAIINAISMIETGFRNLEKLKAVKVDLVSEKKNKAR